MSGERQRAIRVLAIVAITGSWLFTVAWLVAPLWQDHYRPLTQAVSEMGGKTANLPGIIDAAFAVWALAIAACAAALRAVMPRVGWRTAVVGTLALATVAMLAVAFARTDCSVIVNRGCYDRAHAGTLSTQNAVHGWSAVVFGFAVVLSSLAVAGFLRRRRPLLALLPGIGGAIGLFTSVADLVVRPPFDPNSHYGIFQRVWLLMAAGWIEVLGAAVLVQLDERRARPRRRAAASAAPQTWSAGRPTQPSA